MIASVGVDERVGEHVERLGHAVPFHASGTRIIP